MIIMVLFIVFLPSISDAQRVVTIGLTSNQPPYAFEDGTGLTNDIINEINKVQSDFKFIIKLLPAARLREYFINEKLDMSAMMNINWGYNDVSCSQTENLMKVQDKYFARKDVAQNQSFFSKIGRELTVGVLGFHYNYADSQTNYAILEEKSNTILVNSELTVIKMILAGRGKIGVVSSTTLDYYKLTNPDQYNKLLISDISDSEYYRYFLIHDNAEITVKMFNQYMNILKSSGMLKKIFNKYGLEYFSCSGETKQSPEDF